MPPGAVWDTRCSQLRLLPTLALNPTMSPTMDWQMNSITSRIIRQRLISPESTLACSIGSAAAHVTQRGAYANGFAKISQRHRTSSITKKRWPESRTASRLIGHVPGGRLCGRPARLSTEYNQNGGRPEESGAT